MSLSVGRTKSLISIGETDSVDRSTYGPHSYVVTNHEYKVTDRLLFGGTVSLMFNRVRHTRRMREAG